MTSGILSWRNSIGGRPQIVLIQMAFWWCIHYHTPLSAWVESQILRQRNKVPLVSIVVTLKVCIRYTKLYIYNVLILLVSSVSSVSMADQIYPPPPPPPHTHTHTHTHTTTTTTTTTKKDVICTKSILRFHTYIMIVYNKFRTAKENILHLHALYLCILYIDHMLLRELYNRMTGTGELFEIEVVYVYFPHVIRLTPFPLWSYFSVVVCLRCLLHHMLSLIAYTFRENWEFVFIIIVQFMMSANIRIRFGLQIVLVCLYSTPSHYHHCANLSAGIELIKCLSDIFCREYE